MSSAPPAKLRVSLSGACGGSRGESSGARDSGTARDKLRRHGGHVLAVHLEAQRHTADHVVGIGIDVERADVAPEAHGGTLSRCRQKRTVLMLNLAEHHLARASAKSERAQ